MNSSVEEVISGNSIEKDIAFYEAHLQHLENNKHKLDYSFVQEERTAIINLIGELQNKKNNEKSIMYKRF